MAKKKSGPRKAQKKRNGKQQDALKTHLKKTIAGIFLLIILVAAAGLLVHYVAGPKPTIKSITPKREPPALKTTTAKKPAFEIFPKKDTLPREPLAKPKATLDQKRPKVAIIIDDLGYDSKIAQKFIELDAVLTFAVLPHTPFQRKLAESVKANGFETMLHLPMEPVEYPAVNPGKGALLTSMTPDQLIDQLIKSLDSVPNIKGVNNHMGSKMTTSSTHLYQIFSVLKKHDLYFIDSRTTAATLCKPSARLFQVPFAQRDVFLDNIQKPEAIRKQINQLILIAGSHGEAIGIGHPHPVTYEVLREILPALKAKVQLVPASAVVHLAG